MEGLCRIYGGFMEDLRRIYGGFIVDLWTRAESVYFHHRTKQAQPSPKPKAEAEPKNPKEVSRELSVVRWPALLVQEEDSWTTVSQCFRLVSRCSSRCFKLAVLSLIHPLPLANRSHLDTE